VKVTELSEKALRGVAAIRDMLGDEAADGLAQFAESEHFGAALSAQALEFAYADNWDEGSLSRREKSLLLIAALVALRQPDELKNHVRLGLANGIAREELERILVQLVPYVGFPAASTASKTMREMLKEE